MKFIIDNWQLFALTLASGGALLWPVIMGGTKGGATPAQVVQLMNRERAVVVDVCEPSEFAAGHVTGSKNLPLADFEKRLPETVKNKGLPLILVCASGARATRALGTAQKLGYQQAQVLAGGLGAWRTANLPLEKA